MLRTTLGGKGNLHARQDGNNTPATALHPGRASDVGSPFNEVVTRLVRGRWKLSNKFWFTWNDEVEATRDKYGSGVSHTCAKYRLVAFKMNSSSGAHIWMVWTGGAVL